MKTFVVGFWSRAFEILARISLFSLVRSLFPKMVTAGFVDAWVLGHLILAFAALMFSPMLSPDGWVGTLVVFYGLLRVFEIAAYQANVLLFDEYRAVKAGKAYAIEGYRRIVLLLLHNYAEIILWLGCTYTVYAHEFSHKWEAGARTVLGGVYSSFITMTTFGEYDLLPKSAGAAAILLFHATIGLFMTLLSLARFISLIPAPRTRDSVETTQLAALREAGAGMPRKTIKNKKARR